DTYAIVADSYFDLINDGRSERQLVSVNRMSYLAASMPSTLRTSRIWFVVVLVPIMPSVTMTSCSPYPSATRENVSVFLSSQITAREMDGIPYVGISFTEGTHELYLNDDRRDRALQVLK